MKYLDITLPTVATNLALDEALLEDAEAGVPVPEVLRVWESPELAVVIGRSSRIETEVNRNVCRSRGIPVLRRCSGGAAVVIGPGCLMYSLVLSYQLRPELRFIESAHRFILDRLAQAVGTILAGAEQSGISDLTVNDQKFSGNSLRCKRDHLLYHGTVLYQFPMPLIDELLKMPPRQPDYRSGRSHRDFLTSLNVSGASLRQAICESWQVETPEAKWPQARTQQLVIERYGRPEWHECR